MPRCGKRGSEAKQRALCGPQREATRSELANWDRWSNALNLRERGYILMTEQSLQSFYSLPGHERFYVGEIDDEFPSLVETYYRVRWREDRGR